MSGVSRFAAKSLSPFAVAFAFAACSAPTGSPKAETSEQVGEAKAALQAAPQPLGCDTAECCPPGTTPVVFDDNSNVINNSTPNRCLVMLGGSDSVFSSGAGSAVLGGPGDENIQAGPGSQVRGGDGRDTINGFSGGTVLGNGGDDTIMAANGDNFIYPGAGIDNVSGGTGNDTVVIYDLCEVSFGDMMEGSSGTNTLITPVPVSQLQSMGVTVSHFQNVIVQANSCKSDCVAQPDCNGHGHCIEGATTGQVACQCDPGFSPPNCKGCPPGSIKATPGQCGCGVPDTDSDGDGVADCIDACPRDSTKKTDTGICGCNVAETDSDLDGIPDCADFCKFDRNKVSPGICGCSDQPAPAGTVCTDGPCGKGTCDGAGTCVPPAASNCSPDTNCVPLIMNHSIYWFCPGPRNWTDANQRCRALAGRRLVTIDTSFEDVIVSRVLGARQFGTAWLGGNDQAVEGQWRWANATSDAGDPFWSGTASGSALGNRFTKWASAQPDGSGNCASIASSGTDIGKWSDSGCTQAQAFVCESSDTGIIPRDPPKPKCTDFFPERICNDQKDSPLCVPASTFQQTDAGAAATEAQIKACNDAFAAGTCTPTNCPQCQGIAAPPPSSASQCTPFERNELAGCEFGELGGPCSVTAQSLVETGFEADAAGFTYADDAFGTAQPAFASGVRITTGGRPDKAGVAGAALQVTVGGVNNLAIQNMSGGWSRTFTLSQAATVVLTLDYNLTQAPNYETNEFSRVLVRVDGTFYGEAFSDFVAQVTGDNNGGPEISTGWQSFTRNLGVLSAGTHTLTVGAFNNQKTTTDEATTLRIDNVKIESRVSSGCAPEFICGRVSSGEGTGGPPCRVCDETTNGKCSKECPGTELRCGKPLIQNNPLRACASNDGFPTLCQNIEVCASPDAGGNSNPLADPASNLDAQVVTPSTLFPPAPDAGAVTYPADPPCPGQQGPDGKCAAGQNHQWCKYAVADPLENQPVADKKPGRSGSGSPVTFDFDSDLQLNFDAEPKPFGQSKFDLLARAEFKASVAFNLGPASGSTDIINAVASLEAHRCSAKTSDSKLDIFGEDFFPTEAKFDKTATGCEAALTRFETAAHRAKKALRDAQELITQFKALGPGQRLPDTLCKALLGDELPEFFGGPQCPDHEAPDVTVNRFVNFYHGEVNRLRDAVDRLNPDDPANAADGSGVLRLVNKTLPLPLPGGPNRETETIVQANFFIGPIPVVLEVEGFVEYGLTGELVFNLNVPTFKSGSGPEPIAFVDANVGPFAGAGVTFFVGVGFGFNGFDVSAGVEGAISLGSISLSNRAGAGIVAVPQPDNRPIPSDLLPVSDGISLFPVGARQDYAFKFGFTYGSSIVLDRILQGSVAGRVRIKIAFFSKRWRQVILRFGGFGPIEIPLISGGSEGGQAKAASGEAPWDTVQMPLPFVGLVPVTPSDAGTGAQVVDFDKSRVEEVAYDSLCQCKPDNVKCFRNADCCNKPSAVCFSDPQVGGDKACKGCRHTSDSCNTKNDCCNSTTEICYNNPTDTENFGRCHACLQGSDTCNLGVTGECCPGTRFGCMRIPGIVDQPRCLTCLPEGAECTPATPPDDDPCCGSSQCSRFGDSGPFFCSTVVP